jgi:hypothetical protein
VEAELRKEPAANEGTRDSDKEVADNPKSGALHNLAGQPSGDEADQQYDQETFARHVHFLILVTAWKLRNLPLEKGELHQQGQAWPKLNICFNEGGAPLSSEAPCKDEDCAKLITFKGLWIYPHADVNAM